MPYSNPPQLLKVVLTWLQHAFDATTTWVTQLSWWKFFLFAALALIAGSILQDELFSSGPDEEIVSKSSKRANRGGESNILIDDTGIRFNPRNSKAKRTTETPSETADDTSGEHDKVVPPEPPEPWR